MIVQPTPTLPQKPASEEEPTGLLRSHEGQPVPLLGVAVTGEVNGRFCHWTIAQRFRNTEKRAIEAVYQFPLPTRVP
jgi:hypothetical protein